MLNIYVKISIFNLFKMDVRTLDNNYTVSMHSTLYVNVSIKNHHAEFEIVRTLLLRLD